MKRLIKLSGILLSVLVMVTQPSNSQWTQTNGPTGGSITCTAVKGTDIFAGTYNGVYRSSDNGQNWTSASNGITSFLWISDLCVNGSTIFAGTINGNSNGGAFKSTDNGASWISLAGLEGKNVRSFGLLGTIVFAGTDLGLYRSLDNGVTWTVCGNNLSGINAFAVNGTKLFAAGPFSKGVGVSADSGATWTDCAGDQYGGSFFVNTHALAAADIYIFAGVTQFWDGVFMSWTNGANWTGFGTRGANAFAVDGQMVYAGTRDGVYVSQLGLGWNQISNGLKNTNVQTMALIGTNLFAGTTGGMYITDKNTINWSRISTGLVGTTVKSLAMAQNKTGASDLLAFTDGDGIQLSANKGKSWSSQDTSSAILQTRCNLINGTKILAGTYNKGVYISQDSGKSWTASNTGMGNVRVNAFAKSGVNLMASTASGTYLSVNDGANWTLLGTVQFNALAAIGNKFFGGNTNGLYYSTNNGANWTQNGYSSQFSVSCLAVMDTVVLAGGSYSNQTGVYACNDKNLWEPVFGSGGTGAHPIPFSITVIDSTIIVGTNMGIYRVNKQGIYWRIVNTGLTNASVYSFNTTNTDIYAGTGYKGVFSRPLKTILPPDAPKSIIVTDSSYTSFKLKWKKSKATDFLRYRVYQFVNSDWTWGVEKLDSTKLGINDTTITWSGLVADKTCYFGVTAVDSFMNESTYSFIVSAKPYNTKPIASDDTVSTLEDSPVTFKILTNDFDLNGDKLNIAYTTEPKNGKLKLNADTSITYTPNLNFFGSDTFIYVLYEKYDGRDTGTVIIHVLPVNDPLKYVGQNYQDFSFQEYPPFIYKLDKKRITDYVNDVDNTKFSVTAKGKHLLTDATKVDSIFMYSPSKWYGTDTITVVISDGEFTDTTFIKFIISKNYQRLSAFNLLSPTNWITTDSASLIFTWEASKDFIGDAVNYIFHISEHPGPGSDTIIKGINKTSLQFNGSAFLKPNNQYEWSVDATNGVDILKSNLLYYFSTGQPLTSFNLLLPAANSVIEDTSVLFTWELSKAFSGKAVNYTFNLQGTGSDTTISGISATQLQFNGSAIFQPNGWYQWTVKANSGAETQDCNSQGNFTSLNNILKVDRTNHSPDIWLGQNYPNPFSSLTRIQFLTSSNNFVTLKIYDLYGKEVAQLVSSNLPGGNYVFDWNAEGLNVGIYICRLQIGNDIQTRKMNYMK